MKGVILFIQSFSTGILAPALSLVLLSKGISLSDLAIVMGIYSLSVVVLEVPTGIISDIAGHKVSFVFSQALSIVSLILFIAGSIPLIYIGSLLFGTARALSSGSLDAVYINEKSESGDLSRAVSTLNLLSGVGLATGSIIGGLIISFLNKSLSGAVTYNLLLIIRTILSAVIIALSITFIKDMPKHFSGTRNSISNHTKQMISIISKNTQLLVIVFSALSIGTMLFAIETYWQPFFLELPNANSNFWLLGIISFFFFAGSSIGNILGSLILNKNLVTDKHLMIISRTFLAISIIGLAFSNSILMYMLFIIGCYISLGVSSIPEGILININTPDSKRASVLSLSSLALQTGGLCGSLLGKIIVLYFDISLFWLICSFIMITTVIMLYFVLEAKYHSTENA